MRITRTVSPYFSPNSATAPDFLASSKRHHRITESALLADLVVDQILDAPLLVVGHRLEVREVEAQAIGRDQRALLRHVRAEHLLERQVQKVRRRVVGADGVAARVVDGEAWPLSPTPGCAALDAPEVQR